MTLNTMCALSMTVSDRIFRLQECLTSCSLQAKASSYAFFLWAPEPSEAQVAKATQSSLSTLQQRASRPEHARPFDSMYGNFL